MRKVSSVAGNPENLSTQLFIPGRKGLRLISTEHLCNIQLLVDPAVDIGLRSLQSTVTWSTSIGGRITKAPASCN